ncbi:MAG: cob(I)yrinic acid a,c-diamide adenosyltransferase [Candidatus Paceibacterota bacterium]
MLYTKKGDKGTTKLFDCDQQRISKSSAVVEALGSLDEINSFLGLCKIKSDESGFFVGKVSFKNIVENVQQNLFIIQAEMAGAQKTIEESKITELEEIINVIEKKLPPIKTFFVSGGSELAALFDIARTIARRAERRVVEVNEKSDKIGEFSIAYMNRLSSLLYALARLSNHKCGIKEGTPNYK